MVSKPHPYAYAVAGFVAVAVMLTLIAGTPQSVPEVALGSSVLFHVERGLLILLPAFLVFVVLIRAWNGELPNEISREGFKYPTIDPKTVEDARNAALLNVVSSEPSSDPEDESKPDDLLALRLKLEAKLAYIAKILLRPPDADCPTFVTIGSLNYDGFLTAGEARTASQVLTVRDEELDTLRPRVRREFLANADTAVKNIRASVFFGLVRTMLKGNNWAVRDLQAGGRRPDLLVSKGRRVYRVVPRFFMGADAEKIEKLKWRLRGETPTRDRDIVVLPDGTANETEPDGRLMVTRLAGLKAKLELTKDPRSLPRLH